MLQIIYKLGLKAVRDLRAGAYGSKLRVFFLKKLGCKCSEKAYIGPNVTIVFPEKLSIGDNTSIHENCYIDASGYVTIGEDVSIAHSVSFVSFNHRYDNKEIKIKSQPLQYTPIIIKDNVWIGCRAVILAGTVIESRTVVGASALCNKIYKGNEVIAGIPGVHIKEI